MTSTKNIYQNKRIKRITGMRQDAQMRGIYEKDKQI